MKDLKGRTALVSGAGGGLGWAIALCLADRGVNLALSSRPATDLQPLLDQVRAKGVKAESVPADLTDPEQTESLIARAEAAIGPLDILVNNAGVEFMRPSFTQRTLAEIDAQVAINLLAVIKLTHGVLPGMIERGEGAVVTVSSAAGKMAMPFEPTYVATKHGTAAFMRSLAIEQGTSGISFSTVFPGGIRDAGMAAHADHTMPPLVRAILTRRPVDVGNAVVKAITDRKVEVIVSGTPVTLPALLDKAAPSLYVASTRMLAGRGKRFLAATGRTATSPPPQRGTTPSP